MIDKISRLFNALTLRRKIITIAGIVFILASILILTRSYLNDDVEKIEVIPIQTVALLPASELSRTATEFTITGTLRSKSEADLRVDVAGRVTGIYAKVGSWVKGGTLIAEVENSAQKAQLTQALGSLQAAKAQLSKVQGGTREEQLTVLTAALTSADSAHSAAEQSAYNSLLGAYATANQNVIHSTDTLFVNASKYNPKVDFTLADSDLRNELSAERVDIRYILDRHELAKDSIAEDINAEILTTIADLQVIKRFYDKLLVAIEKATLPDATATTYAGIVGSARSAMLTQISTLTATNDALVRSENSVNIATANLEQGTTGAQKEDIATAEASVTSALGSYQGALASLEKTRVRAPISGTLSSFNARTGDFIDTSALGRIVGTGGSEVTFYIPSTDNSRLESGDTIMILDSILGTITSVSNSTDPFNQQLEVRADLASTPELPNGSRVTVILLNEEDTGAPIDAEPSNILVPINAIKFDVDQSHMFTVIDTIATTTALIAIPITLGDVLGSMVEVTGVTNTTLIVTDARGLSDGQTVQIASKEMTK